MMNIMKNNYDVLKRTLKVTIMSMGEAIIAFTVAVVKDIGIYIGIYWKLFHLFVVFIIIAH